VTKKNEQKDGACRPDRTLSVSAGFGETEHIDRVIFILDDRNNLAIGGGENRLLHRKKMNPRDSTQIWQKKKQIQ
jgi:hypothetical protein